VDEPGAVLSTGRDRSDQDAWIGWAESRWVADDHIVLRERSTDRAPCPEREGPFGRVRHTGLCPASVTEFDVPVSAIEEVRERDSPMEMQGVLLVSAGLIPLAIASALAFPKINLRDGPLTTGERILVGAPLAVLGVVALSIGILSLLPPDGETVVFRDGRFLARP
jgi:hypothetical protein